MDRLCGECAVIVGECGESVGECGDGVERVWGVC